MRINKYMTICEKVASYNHNAIDKQLSSPKDVAQILVDVLKVDKMIQESFFCFFLNAKGNIIGFSETGRGTITSAPATPREIFTNALNVGKCCSIIIAHNHPSGHCEPSTEDIKTTEKIVEGGKLLDIPVVDHVIIGEVGYYSFKENNLI